MTYVKKEIRLKIVNESLNDLFNSNKKGSLKWLREERKKAKRKLRKEEEDKIVLKIRSPKIILRGRIFYYLVTFSASNFPF